MAVSSIPRTRRLGLLTVLVFAMAACMAPRAGAGTVMYKGTVLSLGHRSAVAFDVEFKRGRARDVTGFSFSNVHSPCSGNDGFSRLSGAFGDPNALDHGKFARQDASPGVRRFLRGQIGDDRRAHGLMRIGGAAGPSCGVTDTSRIPWSARPAD